MRLGVAGQAHDLSVKRISTERIATYAPESSSGDAFAGGVDFERDDGRDLGVPSCCGVFTPSTRVVSIRRGRWWFIFRRGHSDRVDGNAPRRLAGRLRLREGAACRAGVGCVALCVEEGRHGPAQS